MAQQKIIGTHKTTVKNTDSEISVIYHSTEIVNFQKNTGKLTLKTDGWFTNTTKNRMNQAAYQFNLPFYVFQKNFEWFVDVNGNVSEFSDDSITLNI